jgi:predicted metal-dependent hydrolase
VIGVTDDGDVPEPALPSEELAAFAKGVAQFNDGLFFECHDTLEEIWSGVRGPSRAFFQGLIQAAVGFHHLGNGNRPGAITLLGRSLARLDRYPGRYGGVDLASLREAIGVFRRALESGSELPDRPPRIETLKGAAA